MELPYGENLLAFRDSIAEMRNQRPPVPHHRDGGKLKPEEDNIPLYLRDNCYSPLR